MNAARAAETAQHALDMLVAHDGLAALEASEVEELNVKRRSIQDTILRKRVCKPKSWRMIVCWW